LLFKGGNDLLSRAIRYFTGSPYTHTAICLGIYMFESTVWLLDNNMPWELWAYRSGVRMTCSLPTADLYLEPVKAINEAQNQLGEDYAWGQYTERRWYNFLLTVFDCIIYPTRWFWQKIGWVPFSSRYLGTNCSQFVDQVYKAMGVDLWPGRDEATTVPGDYPMCGALWEVKL
jgi:hypothetical protein